MAFGRLSFKKRMRRRFDQNANNSFISFSNRGTAVHGSSFDSYSRAIPLIIRLAKDSNEPLKVGGLRSLPTGMDLALHLHIDCVGRDSYEVGIRIIGLEI